MNKAAKVSVVKGMCVTGSLNDRQLTSRGLAVE